MRLFKNYLVLFALLAISSQLDAYSTLINVAHSHRILSDESRNVSGFSGISSGGSYNVFITMGSKESLRIEGDTKQISEIETVVEDGTLKIRNKKNSGNWKSGNNGKVNIYISAKSLKLIILSGSGDIEVSGVVKSNDISNILSGSGSISLVVEATNYSATISGSGEIEVKGKTENAKIIVNGSGDFKGQGLRASFASARVSGSGNISIHADKALDAAMSGSGNIRYGGNASVKSAKSGSGRISKL